MVNDNEPPPVGATRWLSLHSFGAAFAIIRPFLYLILFTARTFYLPAGITDILGVSTPNYALPGNSAKDRERQAGHGALHPQHVHVHSYGTAAAATGKSAGNKKVQQLSDTEYWDLATDGPDATAAALADRRGERILTWVCPICTFAGESFCCLLHTF